MYECGVCVSTEKRITLILLVGFPCKTIGKSLIFYTKLRPSLENKSRLGAFIYIFFSFPCTHNYCYPYYIMYLLFSMCTILYRGEKSKNCTLHVILYFLISQTFWFLIHVRSVRLVK